MHKILKEWVASGSRLSLPMMLFCLPPKQSHLYPSRQQKTMPHNYSSEHPRPQFHIFKSKAIETSLHGIGDGVGISISA